jgi:hypothetical protein
VALTQDGNLDEYITTFSGLQYQVQMHNSGLDETYFVTQFVRGLKPELAAGVQSQVPKNMKKAVMLAKVQQQLLDSRQMKFSKYNGKNYLPRFDSKPTANTGGLWKERQLRDFRKANGLCIYCGDKYNASHAASCSKRPQAQVHALVANDLDTTLTEETLNQLAMEDVMSEELQQLSLNAISGTADGEVLKIRALVKRKTMLILLDSGSSHNFISPSFLQQVGISSTPMTPKRVQVANGDILLTETKVHQLEWWCQGYTFYTDMQVL